MSNLLKLFTLTLLSSCSLSLIAAEQQNSVEVTYDAFDQVVITSFNLHLKNEDSTEAMKIFLR